MVALVKQNRHLSSRRRRRRRRQESLQQGSHRLGMSRRVASRRVNPLTV
jgi:hypothetical protein